MSEALSTVGCKSAKPRMASQGWWTTGSEAARPDCPALPSAVVAALAYQEWLCALLVIEGAIMAEIRNIDVFSRRRAVLPAMARFPAMDR